MIKGGIGDWAGRFYDYLMFLTVQQTAEVMGVKEHQVYYLLTMGFLEAVKVGNSWRITPEAVRDYKDKNVQDGLKSG